MARTFESLCETSAISQRHYIQQLAIAIAKAIEVADFALYFEKENLLTPVECKGVIKMTVNEICKLLTQVRDITAT